MIEAMEIEAKRFEAMQAEVKLEDATSDSREVNLSVALLQAACDPVRWTVLQRLGRGTTCVCDLQDLVPIAPNLLSYHLKVLRENGLVTTSRRGRWVDYTLAENAAVRLGSALPLAPAARPIESDTGSKVSGSPQGKGASSTS